MRALRLLRSAPALVFLASAGSSLVLSCAHDQPPVAKPQPAAPKAAPVPPPPPPLTLIPAAEARAGLVATFVVPTLDKSLTSGVALVKAAAPLPLDPGGVRDMLLTQAGVPAELVKHLDLSTPVTCASVVGWPGRGPLNAFTFGVRTAADAAPLLAGLGRTVSRRGTAIQIENAAGDRGWFWPQGNVVLFADSEDALVRAGSLAIEARRPGPDDLAVTVYPEMMARAAGSDLKTIAARVLSELEAQSSSSGGAYGPEAMFQLRQTVDYILDTETADLALNLDPAKGAAVLARLHPRAGSKLETVAKVTKAVTLDPAVAAGVGAAKDPAGFVVASNYGAAVLDQLRRQRSRLQSSGSGKPIMAAGKLLNTMVEALTGELWMLGRARPSLSAEAVYQARDAAAAARVQAALSATDKAALAALVKAATAGEGIELKVDKAQPVTLGKAKGVAATMSVPASAKDLRSVALRKLMGKAGVELIAVSIPGNRVAMAFGPGGRARITALASGRIGAPAKGASPSPDTKALSAALDTVGGRSLFFVADLRQAIAAVAAFGSDPRLGMLSAATAGAPIPVLGGMAGDGSGRTLTLDLTLPPAAFAGIGGLVQAASMLPR